MNIWLIQIGEPLPLDQNVRKMRTTILADKLIERKHSVVWWASSFDHFTKKWKFQKDTELGIKEHLKIFALKGLGYKKNLSILRFLDHRIISNKFKRIAPTMPKPDIIIASFPSHDLAYEAVIFAKRNNIPVLIDIRDQWPDIFLNYFQKMLRKLVKIGLTREYLIVKESLKKADGLIAMMPALLDWGLNYAGRQKTWKDKVFYLGDKRRVVSNNISNRVIKILDGLENKFVVLFLTSFNICTDCNILIDCAKRLAGSDIYFLLVGEGGVFKEIEKKARTVPNIILTGWLDEAELAAVLERSKIGVCPLAEQFIDYFPNKIFTYFSAGLPVLTSLQGELKDVIETRRVGFYCPANDSDALLRNIKKLYDDPALLKEMSSNARFIFDTMFDADKIYEGYAAHIESVASDYPKR